MSTPPGLTANAASTGARSTVLRSFLNQASAPGPRDRDVGRAGDRQAEQLGDPPARQLPARAFVLEPDGCGQRNPRLCGRGSEVGRGHLDRIEQHRQRDRPAALEPRERTDDPLLGDVAGEPPAGLARNDLDGEASAHELRLDVPLVDVAREAGELEVECRLVCPHRRCDLGAEEAGLEPLEAADGAEAFALAGRGLDRRGPVGLDAQRRRLDRILLVARGEHHRDTRDALEAALQQRLRLLLRQTADVDAGDLDAVGDPHRRAREGKADQRRQDGDERQGDDDPARHQARRSIPHPDGDRCRIAPARADSVARPLAVICYGVVKLWRASGGGTA